MATSSRAAVGEVDADASHFGGQRHLGFGPTLGVWSGAGGIVGGGGEHVKAWLSGGYSPALIFANARSADRALRFNYYSAYQINADLVVRLLDRPRADVGLLIGYKFNSVLGHGGGVGLAVLYDLSRHIGLHISGGLALFPSAKNRLDREYGYPADRDPSLTPALQGGMNLGLLYYP